MKIVSLNTWMGKVHGPLMDFFKQNQSIDIFCLQEIYHDAFGKESEPIPSCDHDLFVHIQELLPGHIGYFRPAFEDFYGQALFVRKGIQIDEEGDIFIHKNDNPHKRGVHSRNLQYIRLILDGEPTIVANVHGLWNGQGKTDTPDRLNQSKIIRDFLDTRRERAILCGDFNLNPDTKSLRMLEEGMKNLIKEFGITSTRTSFYEKEGKFADYILVSPEIEVENFQVLSDEVSDHAPLLLKI